jgi:drug/metabolite transporter (DMT)-like permease
VILGPLLMIAAVFCFTCLDAVMKLLVQTHDAFFLAWARMLLQVLLLLALGAWLGWRAMLTVRRPGLQLARGAVLMLTTVALVLAWHRMPMTQVYAIGLSAPLIAAALAVWVLGERPHWSQWALTAAAFAGVIIALRPDAPDAGLHLAFPVLFALSSGAIHVMTRVGSRFDTAEAQLFCAAFAAALILTPAMPWVWTTMPTRDWALLGLGAVFGTLAQGLLIAAFSRAPTAIVSPMVYFQVVWAAIIGFLVFGEVPEASTLAGAGIVAICGIALLRSRT